MNIKLRSKGMSFGQKALKYFLGLKFEQPLPEGIKIVNPYSIPAVKNILMSFFGKFYNDSNKRILIFGINPGRFGGGLTGISFTDPVALLTYCEIENDLGGKQELSSRFIYELIAGYGGVKKFFSKYYLSALFPFALIKDGKNYNYYDESGLQELLTSFIISNMYAHIEFGCRKDFAVCLGKKNFTFFKKLNEEYKFFDEVWVLEHPRYIMQYKRKKMDAYLESYQRILQYDSF